MIEPGPASDEPLVPSQRRLQRPPDFTGSRLDSFAEVSLRHGVPGAILGTLCLLHPDMRSLLVSGLAPFAADPARYLGIGLGLFVAMICWSAVIDRRLDAGAVGWIIWLFLVSAWEEWTFRLALPYFAESRGVVTLTIAAIASNILFGVMHYFTLRWKWQWCLGACLGGIMLSGQMNEHFDLALLIGIHWVATYANTPRLPGRRRRTHTASG